MNARLIGGQKSRLQCADAACETLHMLSSCSRRKSLAALTIASLSAALGGPLAGAQGVPAAGDLTLYGVRLKDASAEAFISAATAAGAQRLDPGPDRSARFDTRSAGVPALQRLTLLTDPSGRFVTAQFVIKPYGQENEALRQLLVQKYGLPNTADGARRPFPSFAGRFAPRGSFDWDFASGMKLIYRQPVIGDATLSYTDVEKANSLATPAAQGDLGNRF